MYVYNFNWRPEYTILPRMSVSGQPEEILSVIYHQQIEWYIKCVLVTLFLFCYLPFRGETDT